MNTKGSIGGDLSMTLRLILELGSPRWEGGALFFFWGWGWGGLKSPREQYCAPSASISTTQTYSFEAKDVFKKNSGLVMQAPLQIG